MRFADPSKGFEGIRWLAKKLDYQITHTLEGYRDFVKLLPIIKFTTEEE
jgi:hypothetical protein